MDKFKRRTATKPKQIGTPKTVVEKYEKLRQRNPALDILASEFDLEINL